MTWQPHGQGHRTRTSYVASANLAAVHAEALREFPAGLAAWTATPLTAAPPLWVAEDADMSGKKDFFPVMSASSSATGGSATGLDGAPLANRNFARLPMAERPLSAIVDFTKNDPKITSRRGCRKRSFCQPRLRGLAA